jgi:DNA-binding transcriptional LysR family regulator
MDFIRCFETFCAVIESGSFTLAGNKLYLTQPSISTHIRDLENHYGVTLLNRKRDGVVPTDAGKILYEQVKEIIKLTRQTEDSIDEVTNLKRGDITIGASTVPGTYILPRILKEFKKKFSKIHLFLKIRDTAIVTEEVFGQQVDFGIVGDRIKRQGLEFSKLTSDRIVFIAPPSEKKHKIALSDLKNIPLVFRETNSGTRMAVTGKLTKKGIRIKDLRIEMLLGSTEAVKQGVMSGLGASFVSERTIQNELSQGLLKTIKIGGLDITRNFWLVKRTSGSISRAGKILYDFIKKECR